MYCIISYLFTYSSYPPVTGMHLPLGSFNKPRLNHQQAGHECDTRLLADEEYLTI